MVNVKLEERAEVSSVLSLLPLTSLNNFYEIYCIRTYYFAVT
jgi:hypothetical protein